MWYRIGKGIQPIRPQNGKVVKDNDESMRKEHYTTLHDKTFYMHKSSLTYVILCI